MTTTTRITVEIELEVEGTFIKGNADRLTIYQNEEIVGDHFEDLDITAAIIDGKAHTIRVWAAPWNDILEANRSAIIEALLEAHTA